MTAHDEWAALRTALGAMALESTLEAAARVVRERDGLAADLAHAEECRVARAQDRLDDLDRGARDAIRAITRPVPPRAVTAMSWEELAAEHVARTGEPPPWDDDHSIRRAKLEDAVRILRGPL